MGMVPSWEFWHNLYPDLYPIPDQQTPQNSDTQTQTPLSQPLSQVGRSSPQLGQPISPLNSWANLLNSSPSSAWENQIQVHDGDESNPYWTTPRWTHTDTNRGATLDILMPLLQDTAAAQMQRYHEAQPAMWQMARSGLSELGQVLGPRGIGQATNALSGYANQLNDLADKSANRDTNLYNQFKSQGGKQYSIGDELAGQEVIDWATHQLETPNNAAKRLNGLAYGPGPTLTAQLPYLKSQGFQQGGQNIGQSLGQTDSLSQFANNWLKPYDMAAPYYDINKARSMGSNQNLYKQIGPASIPQNMSGVQSGIAKQAQELLNQPAGLTPEVQNQIIRGVRNDASTAREAAIERAAADMGNRGLGARGSMGAQNIINAYNQEGQQVGNARRQLATQAALARPGEIQSALGAAGQALGQAQQYGLQNTAQQLQAQQAQRAFQDQLEQQRLQHLGVGQNAANIYGQYGMGLAGLGSQAERLQAQNQQAWNQTLANQIETERGQNINARLQNAQTQLNAATAAGDLWRNSAATLGQLGNQMSITDLQRQGLAAGQQNAWNQLMSNMVGQQAGFDTNQLSQTAQLLSGAAALNGQQAQLYGSQIPMFGNLIDYGLQNPQGQQTQALQGLQWLVDLDNARREAKRYNTPAVSRSTNMISTLAPAFSALGGAEGIGNGINSVLGGVTSMLGMGGGSGAGGVASGGGGSGGGGAGGWLQTAATVAALASMFAG